MRRALVLVCLLGLVATGCEDQPAAPPAAVTAEVNVPGQPPAVTHGDDRLPPRPPALVGQLAPEAAWPCEGTGVDGRRVQLVYIHSGAGNLASLRPSFESIARRIEGAFLASARAGGGERLVRFVTDAGCNLSILDAVVSPQALASFDQTIAELAGTGLDRNDRIYHAWAEANTYCGIGTVYTDDSPAGNLNDQFAQYSRSDRQCWNYAETHEIAHNLGAVQNSAPNSTGGLHSRDEHDIMSYPDGAPRGQMLQPFPCPDVAGEDRLDCRGDDYFAVSPVGGSYLATRWNIANSSALVRSTGSTTSTVPPTSTSSTSSSTTSTTTGTGRTTTDLRGPSSVASGSTFTVTATVSGTCGPAGVVLFKVSGREMSRQMIAGGTASVRLTITGGAARPTIRADYLGDGRCAKSFDTARPRVT